MSQKLASFFTEEELYFLRDFVRLFRDALLTWDDKEAAEGNEYAHKEVVLNLFLEVMKKDQEDLQKLKNVKDLSEQEALAFFYRGENPSSVDVCERIKALGWELDWKEKGEEIDE